MFELGATVTGIFCATVFIALGFSFNTEFRKKGTDSVLLTIWKYFSYYTTLTNFLVFLWLLIQICLPNSEIGMFASNSNVSSAIMFYLVTVGLGNYLLYGWQSLPLYNRISDLLVHMVTPLLAGLYWWFYIDKAALSLSLLHYWLFYPLTYAVYTVVHGIWSGFYPYDFTNVKELGIQKMALNIIALSAFLLLGGYGVVMLGKGIS